MITTVERTDRAEFAGLTGAVTVGLERWTRYPLNPPAFGEVLDIVKLHLPSDERSVDNAMVITEGTRILSLGHSVGSPVYQRAFNDLLLEMTAAGANEVPSDFDGFERLDIGGMHRHQLTRLAELVIKAERSK